MLACVGFMLVYAAYFRFMVKPQNLIMPELELHISDEADTHIASIEVQEGDLSRDSMDG